MNQNLIGIWEMAEKLDVPVSWLYSRTRTNEIPHFKVGKYVKFDPEKVMMWVRSKVKQIWKGGVNNLMQIIPFEYESKQVRVVQCRYAD